MPRLSPALALLPLLAACGDEVLLHRLDEPQANQVLVALGDAGVAARKERDGADEGTFQVAVRPSEAAVARSLLSARDLPRAEKLAKLLYGQSRRTPPFDPEALPDDGYVEDQLTIERVEPGWPHFNGGLFATGRFGPVKVSPKASELTRVGWRVTITLARIRGAWTIVEVGNVYPD